MVGYTTAEGNDIDVCVQSLAAALRNGPLALGFEAPMFVPIRTDPKGLTAARAEPICLSLLGAMMLRTGRDTDSAILHDHSRWLSSRALRR
jgi:hypothetical protein